MVVKEMEPTCREKHKQGEKDRLKEKQMRKRNGGGWGAREGVGVVGGGGGGQFVPVFGLRESISQPLKKDREA